ncbi:hypothetical protein GCM10022254_55110 [Actinomadura meridiana]|uniref:Uncharacterized protein n=1 Tax=Actinomadura meridiana TaxID=559626 RepID=A0ABP8CFB4_9ACTN
MALYGLTVDVGEDFKKMREAGYVLYGFKGVSTTVKNAEPVIWFTDSTYGKTNIIQWSKAYQGYTSTYDPEPKPVVSYNPYDVDMGQTLEISDPYGSCDRTGSVNPKDPITIYNDQAHTQFRVGIAEKPSNTGKFTPLCVTDIDAKGTVKFTPVEKILLIFATEARDEGAVITQAFSAGVLVDLSDGVPKKITYSRKDSWGGFTEKDPWVHPISYKENIVAKLIGSA